MCSDEVMGVKSVESAFIAISRINFLSGGADFCKRVEMQVSIGKTCKIAQKSLLKIIIFWLFKGEKRKKKGWQNFWSSDFIVIYQALLMGLIALTPNQ